MDVYVLIIVTRDSWDGEFVENKLAGVYATLGDATKAAKEIIEDNRSKRDADGENSYIDEVDSAEIYCKRIGETNGAVVDKCEWDYRCDAENPDRWEF